MVKLLYDQSIHIKNCTKIKLQVYLCTFSTLDILSHCSHTTSKVGSLYHLENMNAVLLADLIQFSERRGTEKE